MTYEQNSWIWITDEVQIYVNIASIMLPPICVVV